MANASIENLQAAVESIHQCKASLVRAEPVNEQCAGMPIWRGVVYVFEVDGTDTQHAYAWFDIVDAFTKEHRVVSVLANSPVEAVLSTMAA